MNSREFKDLLVDFIIGLDPKWVFFGERHLDPNEITQEDLSLLIACIEQYHPTMVGLAHIGINDEQITYLAKELLKDNNVNYLYLPFNDIGDAGAAALAELMMQNKSIKKLILFCNKITDVGVSMLANALIANDTLTKIELFSNPFTDAVLSVFKQAIAANHEIEKLTLYAPRGEKKLPPDIQAVLDGNKIHHQQNKERLLKLSLFSSRRRQKQLKMLETISELAMPSHPTSHHARKGGNDGGAV